MKIINALVMSRFLFPITAIQAEEVCFGGKIPSADRQTCVNPEIPLGYSLDSASWDVKFVDDSIGNAYGCNYYGYG